MNATHWEVFHRIVRECTTDLFASLDVRLRYLGHTPGASETPTIAVLGFGGEPVRGCLVVEAPDPLLEATLPFGPPSPPLVMDWAGELANQLCGRIKNRLLDHGVSIQLGTPTVIRGRVSAVTGDPTAASAHRFVADDQGVVAVRFSAVASGEVVLRDPPSESTVPEEGDCLLF